MDAKAKLKQEVVQLLRKGIGKGYTVVPDILETPPKKEMGDFAFPCFELAKGEGRNPVEIATELAAKMAPGEYMEKIVAVGPYVNFYFNDRVFTEMVLTEVAKEKTAYGSSHSGDGKVVVVEGAQPNTHKEFHIGHLRNAVLPQALVNILRANGYKVTYASYIGDIGAHVAKALWGMKKFHDGEVFLKEERAQKLGEMYVEATAYVADHEEAKEEIAEVQRQLEAKEEPWYALWKETREWSIAAFKRIFKELSVKPDVWYFESEVEDPGKELVKKMLTDGVAKKSEGATVVDLEDEGLGVFLILKSDGSSLYATKDLALAYKKQKDLSPDRQIFVVDIRQSHYFKQLFATLKRMGFSGYLNHLAYGMVTLPEGTMSSRSGNVITYDELRDKMVDVLRKETQARHEDWSEKDVHRVAETLALASLKFTMLRQDADSEITFDINEALSFDGFTAPYILYTYARIQSIKRQAKRKAVVDASLLTHPKEQEMIRHIADLPDIVQQVSQSFNVSRLALWAFEMAKLFSEYYHQVRILDDENVNRVSARLALCDAVAVALKNTLNLLGIEVLEEM